MTAKHEIKSEGMDCKTFELRDEAVYIKVRTGHFVYIDQSIDGEVTVSAWGKSDTDPNTFDKTLKA